MYWCLCQRAKSPEPEYQPLVPTNKHEPYGANRQGREAKGTRAAYRVVTGYTSRCPISRFYRRLGERVPARATTTTAKEKANT